MVCLRFMSDEDLARFRTKSCRRLESGGCRFNDRCQYSHDHHWARRCPFLLAEKMPILSTLRYLPMFCPDSMQGNEKACARGSRCTLSHTREEVYYHPLMYKRFPCVAFEESGKCANFYCPWTHSERELREGKSYFLSVPSQAMPKKRHPRLSNASTASCTTDGENLNLEEESFFARAPGERLDWTSPLPFSATDNAPSMMNVIPKRDLGCAATTVNLTELSVCPSGNIECRDVQEGDIVMTAVEFNEGSVSRIIRISNTDVDNKENIVSANLEAFFIPSPLLATAVGEGLRVASVSQKGTKTNWIYCQRLCSPNDCGWIHVMHLFGYGRIPVSFDLDPPPSTPSFPKNGLPQSIVFGPDRRIPCPVVHNPIMPHTVTAPSFAKGLDCSVLPHPPGDLTARPPMLDTVRSSELLQNSLFGLLADSNSNSYSDLSTTGSSILGSIDYSSDAAAANKLLADLFALVENDPTATTSTTTATTNPCHNTPPPQIDSSKEYLQNTFPFLYGCSFTELPAAEAVQLPNNAMDLYDEDVCELLANAIRRNGAI